jgi:serine/threonine-protein kinase
VTARRCPLCDLTTEEKVCPTDRLATLLVDTSSFRATEPKVGDVLAERYEIEEAIGRGGHGRVFRARHLGTGQDVALKILLPQPGTEDAFIIKRFFLEARVTSGLEHPNTIKVFDFGQEDSGLVYLAMELLSGSTLREELRERRHADRPYSEREAVEIGIAVTRSLGEAHAAGLVHRDLKPDNIFLHRAGDDEPTIKVLDFGIVKLGDGQHTLSSTTSVPGTPAYMSPEHALNQNVDGRSDLYSLGVILYQLVTLDLPFRGPSDPQTLYMHAYNPVPDLAEHAKAPVSDRFAAVVGTALAKRPEDRFSDARAMRDALKACVDQPATSEVPEARMQPRARPRDAQALPMHTPHADSGMIPVTRPVHPWERRTLAVGAIGIVLSIGALILAVGERAPPLETRVPADEAAPIAAIPDASIAEAPDADAAAVSDEPEAKPIDTRKAVRSSKRRHRRAAAERPPEAPPPPAEPSPEEEKRKRLLHMNLDDLEESKR